MNNILKTHPNPDNRKSWMITAEVKTPKFIVLRFVPDKLISDHNDLKKLIQQYANNDELTPEKIVLNLIEDVNNELVPKWLEVSYEHNGICVKAEDQQPGQN